MNQGRKISHTVRNDEVWKSWTKLIISMEIFFLDLVLGPITSVAKLKLNMNPELDSPPFEVPKVDLYLEMEKLAVGITRAQYQVCGIDTLMRWEYFLSFFFILFSLYFAATH